MFYSYTTSIKYHSNRVDRVGFAQHYTGHFRDDLPRTQSSKPITRLILVNKFKQQPNYNTDNLNNTYKYLLLNLAKLKTTKLEPGLRSFMPFSQETDQTSSTAYGDCTLA